MDQDILSFDAESDEGNVEYKQVLNETRLEKLCTQMRYRVVEGNGEAYYYLGVADDGSLVGMTEEIFEKTMIHIDKMAKINNYAITTLSSRPIETGSNLKIYELFIREINNPSYKEVKICIAGNVDSGKSSLLGVLTTNKHDDGRGFARLSVFNFKHEIDTGRTSSIAQHILGFDAWGEIVNYKNKHSNSWPDIVNNSNKIISFYDLAGHEKYLKTTITGLSSCYPDYCFILIGGNMGLSKMTKEHIFLCLSLGIRFVFIVTKMDICKNRENILENTISQIKMILKLPIVRKIPYFINKKDDVITASKNMESEGIVPIFKISNVTGENIDLLKLFLNLVQPLKKEIDKINAELHIDSKFSISGIGTVVCGELLSGQIKINDKLHWGPDSLGKYTIVQVKSIHVKRVSVMSANYGTYVCVSLRKVNVKHVRRGQVLLSSQADAKAYREFSAKISVIRAHATTIKQGYEPVVHVGNVRQTAKIISINDKKNGRKGRLDDEFLRTGDEACVRFRFSYKPEFIKVNNKLLFCEGRVKAIGTIKEIY